MPGLLLLVGEGAMEQGFAKAGTVAVAYQDDVLGLCSGQEVVVDPHHELFGVE